MILLLKVLAPAQLLELLSVCSPYTQLSMVLHFSIPHPPPSSLLQIGSIAGLALIGGEFVLCVLVLRLPSLTTTLFYPAIRLAGGRHIINYKPEESETVMDNYQMM